MDKVRQDIFRRKGAYFLHFGRTEKRERKGEAKGFFRQSTEFRRSEFVEPRTKVHRFDEGYAWVPKTRDFIKDSKEEIWENQSFRA